ncbi:MAG: hypothetical protein NZ653_10100, partial [Anaerolineae bacterium]|nr:hypothetical protein [Anaerolineae bacterium]
MKAIIPTSGKPAEALIGLLKTLLRQGMVKAWLLPISSSGNSVNYALVREEAILDKARPFAPVMYINLARALSTVAKRGGGGKIGALLRPCEQRAFVELVKFHQIDPQSVLIVGMDCPGTYELKDYSAFGEKEAAEEALLLKLKDGEILPGDGLRLRQACEICVHFIPVMDGGYTPELAVRLLGMDPLEAIVLEGDEGLLGQLGLEGKGEPT